MSPLWSYSTGDRGRSRVRVYERKPGGSLQIEWVDGDRRVQASLRSVVGRSVADRREASEIADAFSRRLDGSGATAGDTVRIRRQRRRQARSIGTAAMALGDRIRLDADTLLGHRLPVEPLCGIYFLLGRRSEVVYVGQSRDIMARLAMHRKAPPAAFTSVAWQPFAVHELDAAEAAFIERFRPPGNRSRPTRPLPAEAQP